MTQIVTVYQVGELYENEDVAFFLEREDAEAYRDAYKAMADWPAPPLKIKERREPLTKRRLVRLICYILEGQARITTGPQELFWNVLRKAVEDLINYTHREDAAEWLYGENCSDVCDGIMLEQEWVLKTLTKWGLLDGEDQSGEDAGRTSGIDGAGPGAAEGVEAGGRTTGGSEEAA